MNLLELHQLYNVIIYLHVIIHSIFAKIKNLLLNFKEFQIICIYICILNKHAYQNKKNKNILHSIMNFNMINMQQP